jgi:hypothetical protein
MARSSRWLGLSVAGALLASVLMMVPALARTPAGPGSGGDYLTVHKGGSIQSAVDRAEPGDTIFVEPGTYKGSVFIDKDRIRLIGAGAHETKIVPGGQRQFCGICVFGDTNRQLEIVHPVTGVVIKGFWIEGFHDFGIGAFGTESLSVRNNIAANNGEYGITAFTSVGGQFVGNEAWGSGEAGFYVGDSPNARFELIDNSAHDNDYFGYLFRDANKGWVTGNDAYGNCSGFFFVNTGASFPTVKRWRVENNQSWSNNEVCRAGDTPISVAGLGYALGGTSHVKLIHNFGSNNEGPGGKFLSGGIAVFSTKALGGMNPIGNVVERNKLHGNEPYDIWYDGSGRNNSFDNNRCQASSPRGICS